jgi:hypothetical protein
MKNFSVCELRKNIRRVLIITCLSIFSNCKNAVLHQEATLDQVHDILRRSDCCLRDLDRSDYQCIRKFAKDNRAFFKEVTPNNFEDLLFHFLSLLSKKETGACRLNGTIENLWHSIRNDCPDKIKRARTVLVNELNRRGIAMIVDPLIQFNVNLRQTIYSRIINEVSTEDDKQNFITLLVAVLNGAQQFNIVLDVDKLRPLFRSYLDSYLALGTEDRFMFLTVLCQYVLAASQDVNILPESKTQNIRFILENSLAFYRLARFVNYKRNNEGAQISPEDISCCYKFIFDNGFDLESILKSIKYKYKIFERRMRSGGLSHEIEPFSFDKLKEIKYRFKFGYAGKERIDEHIRKNHFPETMEYTYHKRERYKKGEKLTTFFGLIGDNQAKTTRTVLGQIRDHMINVHVDSNSHEFTPQGDQEKTYIFVSNRMDEYLIESAWPTYIYVHEVLHNGFANYDEFNTFYTWASALENMYGR